MFFNKETRQCEPYVKCDPETEFLDRSVNKCEKYVQCAEGQILNKLTNQCQDKPKCNPGKEFYNAVTNKCELYTTCPEGQFLRREYNRCEPFVACPNGILDKETNTCNECPAGQKLDTATNTCVTPPKAPAVKMCDPNLLLNLDTMTCIYRPILYRFNEKAENIIQGKITYDNYQVQIEKAIRSNPLEQVAECPADKPYSLLTKCISCEGSSFILDSQ
jgi:hypothetical protein